MLVGGVAGQFVTAFERCWTAVRTGRCGDSPVRVSPLPASRFRRPGIAAALIVALAPAPALAHAILLSSSPRAGEAVEAGTLKVELRFNSRIDRERSSLQLAAPDKTRRSLPLATGAAPDTLRSSVDLVPGPYVLRWQVLATDGHLTRGEVPFSVAPKR